MIVVIIISRAHDDFGSPSIHSPLLFTIIQSFRDFSFHACYNISFVSTQAQQWKGAAERPNGLLEWSPCRPAYVSSQPSVMVKRIIISVTCNTLAITERHELIGFQFSLGHRYTYFRSPLKITKPLPSSRENRSGASDFMSQYGLDAVQNSACSDF